MISRDGHTTFVRGLTDLTPVESSVEGLLDAVDRVVWNRDGSFAVLYSTSESRLQRLQISRGQPVADPPVDLSPWGSVSTLAIDPAGQQIAVGFATSGLYLFSSGQSPALLSPLAQLRAAVFDNTGNSLFVVDLENQRILQFQSGAGFSDICLSRASGWPGF